MHRKNSVHVERSQKVTEASLNLRTGQDFNQTKHVDCVDYNINMTVKVVCKLKLA